MLSSITKHGLEFLIAITNFAEAAYVGAVRSAGWHYVDLEDIQVPDQYIDETGHFFVNGEAAACVLTNDEGRIVVSFRGKDSPADWLDFPKISNGTYIDYFTPLLVAVAGTFTSESIIVTGHSAGGAAAHQLSELVDELGLQGPLGNAYYVSVASPIFWNDPDVVSFGYRNDPAYGLVDEVNAPDVSNIYWYDEEVYVVDGHNYYPAHDLDNIEDGLQRIVASELFGPVVDLESAIVIDGVNGATFVGAYAATSEPAYYLGVDHWFVKDHSLPVLARDVIIGRAAVDYIDGMGGCDAIAGMGGADRIYGGDEADRLFGGAGHDELSGGAGADTMKGGLGGDRLVFDQFDDGGDVVVDFHTAAGTILPGQEDQIAISTEVFGGDAGDAPTVISGYALPEPARSGEETILYAARSGNVVYDPDGTGALSGILIVTLEEGPAILQPDDVLLF